MLRNRPSSYVRKPHRLLNLFSKVIISTNLTLTLLHRILLLVDLLFYLAF